MTKAKLSRSFSHDVLNNKDVDKYYKTSLRRISSQMYVEKPFFDFDYLEENQRLYNELKSVCEDGRTRNFVLTGFKAVKV